MAARLSGKPAPKKKGKEEQAEGGGEEEALQPQPKPKKEGSSSILMIVLLVFALIAALGSVGLVLYFVAGPGAGLVGNKTAEEKPKEFVIGPTVDMDEFIVNLGNVNDRRFLRTKMTLAFSTTDEKFTKGTPEQKQEWEKKLKDDLKPKHPLFKDLIVTTLSKKTAEEIGTPRGKEQLKQELITRMNEYLTPEVHVEEIYFTDFIVQ